MKSALPLFLFTLGCGAALSCGPAANGRPKPPQATEPCPTDMSFVPADGSRRAFCVDRYEGSLLLVTGAAESPFSPYETVKDRPVRAVSRAGAVPQAYISRNEARAACQASKKRLCVETEWVAACKGSAHTQFPYGESRKPRACNDDGRAPLLALYSTQGAHAYDFDNMNDPRLNQVAGTLSPTGSHPVCTNDYGVYDMVGNLHEWVDDPAGTFRGGYYLDTHLNGDGCNYRTTAHASSYHDYSTGFRCCADASSTPLAVAGQN